MVLAGRRSPPLEALLSFHRKRPNIFDPVSILKGTWYVATDFSTRAYFATEWIFLQVYRG